jgi:hypothetical protein
MSRLWRNGLSAPMAAMMRRESGWSDQGETSWFQGLSGGKIWRPDRIVSASGVSNSTGFARGTFRFGLASAAAATAGQEQDSEQCVFHALVSVAEGTWVVWGTCMCHARPYFVLCLMAGGRFCCRFEHRGMVSKGWLYSSVDAHESTLRDGVPWPGADASCQCQRLPRAKGERGS